MALNPTKDFRGRVKRILASLGLPLAQQDQQITANRSVTNDGDGFHVYINLTDTSGPNDLLASLLAQPGVPRVVVLASEATVSAAGFTVGSDSIDLQLTGAALEVNGNAGLEGQAITSTGAGTEPDWDGYVYHLGATAPSNTDILWFHTTDKQLFYYDDVRAKWLSESKYTIHASLQGSGTNNRVLKQAGGMSMQSSADRGIAVFDPICVVGWHWFIDGTTSARDCKLGSTTTAQALTHTSTRSRLLALGRGNPSRTWTRTTT